MDALPDAGTTVLALEYADVAVRSLEAVGAEV